MLERNNIDDIVKYQEEYNFDFGTKGVLKQKTNKFAV